MSESEESTEMTDEDIEAVPEEMVDGEMKQNDAGPQTLTIEIPLDPMHRAGVEELERVGLDVESEVSQRVQPQVEQVIHEVWRQAKYQQ